MPRAKKVGDDSELRRLTEGAALQRAFQLSHSIYRFREQDRETALQIVWEALRGVGVRLVAQREADRHGPYKPTKVRWNTLQWFQLLLYYKSETHEKRQEAAAAENTLTQEDMIIRYVKHLVLATSRRNSFHITLGLTRLLYDYGTVEAMRIYDLIFQDPDASTKKADAYYRGRKNRLIAELAKRFGGLLRVTEETRGGKRFEAQPDSLQFADLAPQYLTHFTPWETSCALPTPLDTWASVHSLRGSQASQIHSLIHPPCFSRIVGALKLDPPERRLKLPFFFLSRSHSFFGRWGGVAGRGRLVTARRRQFSRKMRPRRSARKSVRRGAAAGNLRRTRCASWWTGTSWPGWSPRGRIGSAWTSPTMPP
jgi:hypothetical protein